MRDKNKALLLFGITLFSMFLVGMVSAAPTLVTPATSSSVNGATVSWNVTNGTLNEMVNCSIYLSSSSTANSTATNVSTGANVTASATNITGTFDSTILEDSNDYSIYASCTNSSGSISNTSASTITIDNTIPQAPSSLSPSSSTDTDGSVSFSATVTGANTTGCTLFFVGKNPGSSSYAMTHSSNSCTYTISSVPEESYAYLIQASDGTNSTNSSQATFLVDIPNGGIPIETLEYIQNTPTKDRSTLSVASLKSPVLGPLPLWMVILLVIGILYWVIKKRK